MSRSGFEQKTVTVRHPYGFITLTVAFWMWPEAIIARALEAIPPVFNIRPEDCEVEESP